MTASRAPRLAAAASVAALAALLGPSTSAAGRLCGTGSGKRPPTDATRSAATVVTAAGLTGPSCYTNGLSVALPSDAGNVMIEDVWVEGTGIAITAIPPTGSLTINDCRVSPTRAQNSVRTFTAVSFARTTGDQGTLRLANTVLDVNGDDWTLTKAWPIAGLVVRTGDSTGNVRISGGAVRMAFAGAANVNGVHITGSVHLFAENVPITVKLTSAADIRSIARALIWTDGGVSGVRSHSHLDRVNLDVTCDGNDCWAYGAVAMSIEGLSFRVRDSTIQVRSGRAAYGFRHTLSFSKPLEVVRSTVTVNAPEAVAIRTQGTSLISESVLAANGSITATPVDANGAEVILHRTVLSGASGSPAVQMGYAMTRLVLVDVDVATPDAATGKCAIAAGSAKVWVRGVRCGASRAPVGEADVIAGVAGAAEAPDECGGGYVVGVVPTVSLDPALPPFRWGDLSSMCLLGVNETPTAITPTARVSVVNVVENVKIANVSLGVLTIVGGVPAGVTVELIGTSLGPLAAAGPSAEPVLEVGGPLLGTLSLTGGAALRGGVHIAGDFGPDALLKVDGASVETAQNAAALAVDGERRGELRLADSGVTVFEGSISAAPAELAKWRAACRLSAGSEVNATDTVLELEKCGGRTAASGAAVWRGMMLAAAAGLLSPVVACL